MLARQQNCFLLAKRIQSLHTYVQCCSPYCVLIREGGLTATTFFSSLSFRFTRLGTTRLGTFDTGQPVIDIHEFNPEHRLQVRQLVLQDSQVPRHPLLAVHCTRKVPGYLKETCQLDGLDFLACAHSPSIRRRRRLRMRRW